MPKMETVAHFAVDMPHATPQDMQEAERLMRDQVAEVLASINTISNAHAAKANFPHPIHITGSIAAVTHHP